jgi:hypothetical protein
MIQATSRSLSIGLLLSSLAFLTPADLTAQESGLRAPTAERDLSAVALAKSEASAKAETRPVRSSLGEVGSPNSVILSLIPTMPIGGGYSATTAATRDLQAAVQTLGGKMVVDPFAARSTYCAGATYMIFVRALQTLLPDSAFSGNVAAAFAIRGQPDGVGVWGRWNANGPGTACLFKELGLGRNFTSFQEAQPGDFMKIFWSGAVGAREHGHSVIYLGRLQRNGLEMIRFWSSNQPNGYGEKIVPRSRIANAIFSRLEVPSNSVRAVTLPERNRYLASLLSRNSSFAEALAESGAEPSFASDRQSTPLRNP